VNESPLASCPQPVRGDMFAIVSQSVSDSDFALFQRLIERETGIHLSTAKKSLLVGRLSRRMRELGLPSLRKYYKRVLADPAELTCMVDCISTNETQFFREPLHFEYLESQVFPRWAGQAAAGERPRHIRVWSAGCSTGEEPYSIAMALLYQFPPSSGWKVEVFATDISTRVLARARAAIWPVEKARPIPCRYLKAFMLRGIGPGEGKMKAGNEIRGAVHFERLNLLDDSAYPGGTPFDLIFCRNVLIYFQPETKALVVRRLLRCLARDGYLFVGHSESLSHLAGSIRNVVPTVYVPSASPNPS